MYRLPERLSLLEVAFASIPDGVLIVDLDGRVLFVNEAGRAILGQEVAAGVSLPEILDQSRARLPDNCAQAWEETPLGRALRGEVIADSELLITRPDGTDVYLRASAGAIKDEGGVIHGAAAIFRALPSRLLGEEKVNRLNRMYAVVSEVNQAIARAADRQALFDEACRAAVEHGKFRMAWIGIVDEGTDLIVPMSWSGHVDGYLAGITISRLDEPAGRGPTGRALRGTHSALANDILNSPEMFPWRAAALRRGYRASAAVPLHLHGAVVGALTVYASEPYFFDQDEAVLLEEISRDLSHALDALEGEAQRRQAMEALQRAREELERRVTERTVELTRTNARLQAELLERHRVEAEREQLLQEVQRRATEAEEGRAALDRQAAELQATFDSIADGVTIYDPAGRIVRVNPAGQRLLGYSEPDINLSIAERRALLAPRTAEGREYKREDLPSERALHGETVRQAVVVVRDRPERLRWLSVSAAPICTSRGAMLGAVVTFTDITALHELEEQREDFIRMISHDLRNPLTAVLGQSQWLQRHLARQGLEREARRAEAVYASGKRMATMIDDLFESIGLTSGRFELHKGPVDLLTLVTTVVEHMGAEEDRARVQIESPEWVPAVQADGDRLERAVANLIGNALKYSTAPAPVRVRIEQADGQALVSVSDQGAGIPAEELPHLFQRFYRASSGQAVTGLGLGLYITRLIVESHGGRVWAESTVGEGSRFSFALPQG